MTVYPATAEPVPSAVHPSGSSSGPRRRGRTGIGQLGYAIPAVVVLGFLYLWPILEVAWLSVHSSDPGAGFSLENYEAVLTEGAYRSVALTTAKIVVATAVSTLVISYPIAYYLVRARSRFTRYVVIIVLAPLLVSAVVRTLGWLILLGDQGPVRDILHALQIPFRGSLIYNSVAIVVALIHLFLPFMVIAISTSLGSVDRRTEEAAAVLGASPAKVFWAVTLPQTRPGILAGLVLVTGLSLGAYLTPAFMGGGQTEVLAISIYTEALVTLDWGRASALAMTVMIAALMVIGIGSYLLTGGRRWRHA